MGVPPVGVIMVENDAVAVGGACGDLLRREIHQLLGGMGTMTYHAV